VFQHVASRIGLVIHDQLAKNDKSRKRHVPPEKNCRVRELTRPQSLIAGLLFRSGVTVGKARSGEMRVLERVWLIPAHWQKWTGFANMIANEDDCRLSAASGFRRLDFLTGSQ
jgi:hypothetical protein